MKLTISIIFIAINKALFWYVVLSFILCTLFYSWKLLVIPFLCLLHSLDAADLRKEEVANTNALAKNGQAFPAAHVFEINILLDLSKNFLSFFMIYHCQF